jgi:hypothetical protein
MWKQRGIEWTSPYHPIQLEIYRQLVTMSILGLGLSGNSRAAEVLRSKTLAEPPGVEETVKEALRANERIARVGLLEYYREKSPPPGPKPE